MKPSFYAGGFAPLGYLLADAYCFGLSVWHLLLSTPVRHMWWVQLVNIFDVWLYLPLPLLLLVALRFGKRLRWLVLLPLMLFLADYSTLFLPHHTDTSGL